MSAQRLFLDETDLVLPQLERALAHDRPDVIVYDVAAFAGLVLAEKWQIPRIQLSPTYVFSPGIEQVLGLAEDTAAKREVRARYDRYFASQGVGLAFQDIAVPQRAIVTIPRGFQYFGDESENSFEFVGPMLSERAFQGSWSPPDDRPVLVISLGSAYNDRRDFAGAWERSAGWTGTWCCRSVAASIRRSWAKRRRTSRSTSGSRSSRCSRTRMRSSPTREWAV